MAAQDFDSVYLLLATLATSRERNLHKLTRLGRGGSLSQINPFSSTVVHWAIQVRDKCYEVTSKDYYPTRQREEFEMRVSSVSQWEERRRRHDLNFDRKKIGATKYPDHKIKAEANRIWTSRFDTIYKIDRQNCQNFAYLLFRRIKVKDADDSIPTEEKRSWKKVPVRLTQVRTLAKKYGWFLIASAVLNGAGKLSPAIFADTVVFSSAMTTIAPVGLMIALLAPVVRAKGRDRKWLKEMEKAEKLLADKQTGKSSSSINSASISTEDLAPLPCTEKALITAIVQAADDKPSEDSLLVQEIRSALQEQIDTVEDPDVYQGYNREMVNDFCIAGFEPREVVAALLHWDIGTFGGKYFSFDEEDMGKMLSTLQEIRSQTEEVMLLAYRGYNKEMIDAYVDMGFEASEVVATFRSWGLDICDGQFYEFNEEDTTTVINTLLDATQR